MLKTPIIRYGVLAALLVTSLPSMARPPQPMPQPQPAHQKPGHPHQNPAPRAYHRSSMPSAASFLIVSGITYAIINGLYYQQHGDQYVYVENPPAKTTTTTTVTTTSASSVGRVVNVLPNGAKSVSVNGANYYVQGGVWYAPIASSNQFVIVEPQL
ncbi:hypothetical protein SAMN04488136_109147 [Vibrio xiamenensis]|uniref:SH3 domain-containing protein n=1 Tax=Vibrio xiamenensis TaxID=861298 RepID=A0A1G8A6I5_9VIBR|nr:hypothetical protein [Vibrio xiamenensis]SDH16000.1 hypothetical protein SAMN04488136_109147 [Vibrio xiamenensis]